MCVFGSAGAHKRNPQAAFAARPPPAGLFVSSSSSQADEAQSRNCKGRYTHAGSTTGVYLSKRSTTFPVTTPRGGFHSLTQPLLLWLARALTQQADEEAPTKTQLVPHLHRTLNHVRGVDLFSSLLQSAKWDAPLMETTALHLRFG